MSSNETCYGGIIVNPLNLEQTGRRAFAGGDYTAWFYRSRADESLLFEELKSFTIVVLRKAPTGSVEIFGQSLEQGDVIQVEGRAVNLETRGSGADLLVAGTTLPNAPTEGVIITRSHEIYRVNKPWGHELWLNGRHPGYALKQIGIKRGNKSSLQYHRLKMETIVLFSGRARMHYKANKAVPTDQVTPEDVATTTLSHVSVMTIAPFTLHRFEAVSDLLFYEVSTPHLDDVIRVADDSGRPSGPIAEEHP